MLSAVCQSSERPSALRRTKQILDAAEACFRLYGFHSTSMAQLAAEAKMSVGNIYRYFPGKHEIISAIVERDVEIALANFDVMEAGEGKMIPVFLAAWRTKLETMCDPDRSALWLEILAEAGRNPQAAQLVREARASVGERLEKFVVAGSAGRWSSAEIAAKVGLLLGLTDAVAFGGVAHPADYRAQLVDQVLACAERLLT